MFSKADLERLFSLDKLNKAAAVFDYKKLEWFNGMYIRERSDESLKNALLPFLRQAGILDSEIGPETDRLLLGAIPIIKERLKFLTDAADLVRFLFKDVPPYPAEELLPKKTTPEETEKILEAVKGLLEDFFARSDMENEENFRLLAEQLGTKLGNILMPLRVALTGSKVSPPLFESVRLLGKEKTYARIEAALQILRANK
jgi:glutamyl-tRNA synthetase